MHIEGLRRFKHHQHSTSRHPERAKWWRETEKKREIVAPHPSGPHLFYVRGAPPFGAPPLGVPPLGAQKGACSSMFFSLFCLFLKQENTETVKLAKVGLAKVGHPNFGQSRSIKDGQSRSQPPKHICAHFHSTTSKSTTEIDFRSRVHHGEIVSRTPKPNCRRTCIHCRTKRGNRRVTLSQATIQP